MKEFKTTVKIKKLQSYKADADEMGTLVVGENEFERELQRHRIEITNPMLSRMSLGDELEIIIRHKEPENG